MHGNRCSVKLAWIWPGTGLAALALPGVAKAEIVAPSKSQALLAVARDGSPRVAFTSGRDVVVARRTGGGWKSVRAGRVPGTRPVLAGLVVDGRLRTSVLLGDATGSWIALASRRGQLGLGLRPPKRDSFGAAGLTLDAAGRPAFAYALRKPSGKTWLRLVTTDVRGRLHTHGITKGGFPSSVFVPGAAPVLVGRRVPGVENYTHQADHLGPKNPRGRGGHVPVPPPAAPPARRGAP